MFSTISEWNKKRLQEDLALISMIIFHCNCALAINHATPHVSHCLYTKKYIKMHKNTFYFSGFFVFL